MTIAMLSMDQARLHCLYSPPRPHGELAVTGEDRAPDGEDEHCHRHILASLWTYNASWSDVGFRE